MCLLVIASHICHPPFCYSRKTVHCTFLGIALLFVICTLTYFLMRTRWQMTHQYNHYDFLCCSLFQIPGQNVLTASASDDSYDFRWWISIIAFSVLTSSKYLLFRCDDCLEVMHMSTPFPVRRMGRSSVFCDLLFLSIGKHLLY